MLDHLEVQTRQVAPTLRFYGALLAPLGYRVEAEGRATGYGDGTRLDFFVAEGEPSSNVHYAFEAPSRAVVNEIYEIGRAHGLKLDREPALAPQIHANYYAGYLRDPDGRLIEFVCHKAA